MKIIVANNVKGNFSALSLKLEELKNKGNSFDALLLVGNNLQPPLSISTLPIPTYFIDSSKYNKIISNIPTITKLQKSGILELNKVRIAYINGIQFKDKRFYQKNKKIAYAGNYYKTEDIEKVRKGGFVDILLSNQRPKTTQCEGSLLISEIIEKIKPIYHFVSYSDSYIEEEYDAGVIKGRLINVASFNVQSQEKYLFAFNIQHFQRQVHKLLQQDISYQLIDYVMFSNFNKNASPSDISNFLNRFYPVQNIQIKGLNKKGHHSGYGILQLVKKQNHNKLILQSQKFTFEGRKIKFEKYTEGIFPNCWFCRDKSLVQNQLAKIILDKAPITQFHMQIVPIQHISSLNQPVRKKLNQLKRLIINKLKEHNLGCIAYEKRTLLSQEFNHYCIHVCPFSYQQLKSVSSQLKSYYQKNAQIQIRNIGQLENEVGFQDYYFYFEVNGPQFVNYLSVYQKRFAHNLKADLGRQLICLFLNMRDRENYRQNYLKDEKRSYEQAYMLLFSNKQNDKDNQGKTN